MKKVVISILLFFVFFLRIDNVKAITGYYTYDINTIKLVTVSGKKYLQLTGWAFITNGHGNIHNVQPKFTMYLEGKKEDGTVVGKSVIYEDASMADKLQNRHFSASCDNPNDYSKGYFSKYVNDAGDTVNYPSPSECSKRIDVLNGNSLAININFSFYIPLEDMIKLGIKDATRIYMHLVSELPGGTITVYGKSVNTQSAKRDITIGIQDSRVSSTLNSQIKSASNKQIKSIDFIDKVKKITVITASRAQGRPTNSMDAKSYYYRRNSDGAIVTMQGVVEGYKTLYYYSEEDAGEERATYTVLNNKKIGEETYSPKALPTIAAAHNKVYVYPVLTSVGSVECWDHNLCLVDEGSIIAWIPAYWIKPIKNMPTYIKIDIEKCAEYQDDPDALYCCEHPDEFPEGSNEQKCCYNPDDPICPHEDPCSMYNGNPDAKYCCLHPEEYPEGSKKQKCCYNPDDPICTPPEDPCDDIEDATKHYCCHYSTDPICFNGDDTEEYPTYDPENKPDMCSETGNTEVEFKFPAEGWSDQIIKNTACIVSCQETLTATFEPVKYVSKAGMGFKYPVDINSARSCAASYNNEYWQSELAKAASAAKVAYNKMNEYLNEAKRLDSICGTKDTIIRSLPSCPSPYTDSRSGQTCKCNYCGTCYHWNWDSEGCHYPSYSCFDWDTHTWGVCEGLKYGCFVPGPPYDCESSTSISCPSAEGYSLDYYSNTDDCRKYVCSSSRALWDSAQRGIADALTIASAQRNEYYEQMTYISKLLGDRNTCDNFPTLYPYSGARNSSIGLTIDNIDNQEGYEVTAQNVVNNDTVYEYSRQRTGTPYTVYNNRVSVYSNDRNLVGDNRTTASGFAGTYYDYSTNPTRPTYYDFWNRKATAYYHFEFKNDWYVQKYTGDLSGTGGTAYLYGGRYAYTDYNVLSGVYGMELNLNNLGPNIPGVSSSLWSIDPFTCRYDVNNVTFPPGEDENHEIYGNVGFMYRQISLTDPFPNRQPHQNWINKEYLIVSNGYSVYSNDPLYKIVLNPLTMQQIRDVYGTNYDSYNASNPYTSILVRDYISRGIITKRVAR